MKTSSKVPFRGAALLMAMSLFTGLYAQNEALPNSPAPITPLSTEKPAHADRAFFEKAAKAGMKEVEVSQAVLGRLTNPQVRDFAQMVIADHSTANSQLTALAVSKGVTLPATSMKVGEKWSKKDGDLDEDYIEEMKEDHEDTVKLFEKAAKSNDADVAAFAQKTLPTLLHHLEMAKSLKKSVK
jgi:putative membrane protein